MSPGEFNKLDPKQFVEYERNIGILIDLFNKVQIDESFHFLGFFYVDYNGVIIADSCYDKNTWYGAKVAAKQGVWSAFVRQQKGINCEITVYSENYLKIKDANNWKLQKFDVGVDSGQVGIFDLNWFKPEDKDVYDIIRLTTLHTKTKAGIILGKGVASSAGHRNRVYSYYTIKRDGYNRYYETLEPEAIAIKIEFVSDKY